MSPLVAAFVPFLMFIMLIGWLWRNQRKNKRLTKTKPQGFPLYPVSFEDAPDMPRPFGYKTQWFAVRTTDTRVVADALRLGQLRRANWRTGMAGAEAGYYYVSPPVQGWTLVVNPYMPDLGGSEERGPIQVLEQLSLAFGEACYFASHRIIGYYAWIKAQQGAIVRGYAYIGERGETILDQGGLSPAEREANLAFAESDAEDPSLPDEEDVLVMARKWTVDPTFDSNGSEAGTGLAGVLEAAE
ncbi:hypothetical protein [Paenibacillus sacheonensis]|uniref:Uncharacterized protein n=1 Tax=Paenibacillus sacheonensis TaxID=742054 RepID=A0A7X5BY44_9BACL|nr:hypothetical protein [Paenibacillus sacheonensis]MBM7564731.1 hypothetical protein [Paenibacillus sacheonensis]NBC69287.1 hypothetical protein [Paenibacillus sacheonensis]